jgi:hypothetical protein
MFYGQILTICKTAFIPISLASYLGLSKPLYTTYGEIISNMFTYLSVFLVFIFYPIAIVANLTVPKSVIDNPDYKKKWGGLTASI